MRSSTRVQNVSAPIQQRVSERIRLLALHIWRYLTMPQLASLGPLAELPFPPHGFENLTLKEDWERYRLLLHELELREQPSHNAHGRSNTNDGGNNDPSPPSCMLVETSPDNSGLDIRVRSMPQSDLPPVYPTRPLNFNTDGTCHQSTPRVPRSHIRDLTPSIGPRQMQKRWSDCSSPIQSSLSTLGIYPRISSSHM